MRNGTTRSEKPWDPSKPNAIDCLQVVYKISERCNLNCSYCYYYNMGDQSALQRPARASLGSSFSIARWLAKGCVELGIRTVHISFHGGEPMLVRATEFARACDAFRRIIGQVAEVRFSIQTNGTLLTKGWLEALKRYHVAVGVSIDGLRTDHDRYRMDHQGRSTFNSTEATIKRLVAESKVHPFLRPGTISVVDRRVEYANTYRYLRSLGIEMMHFLLPDRNADSSSPAVDKEAVEIGNSLLGLFEAWLTEDNPRINVRFISEALGFFQTGASLRPIPRERKSNQILVVRSDETVAIDDSLIPALDWYSTTPSFPIEQFSLRDVFRNPIFSLMEAETNHLPNACIGCNWAQLCRGGDLENRYSKQTGFNNRSVYCKTYKVIYSGICKILLENGYPESEIKKRVGDLEYG